jgi:hypothetical protein
MAHVTNSERKSSQLLGLIALTLVLLLLAAARYCNLFA